MDIWRLYETFATEEGRAELTTRQRQVLAVCDLRQEVNAGGFDSYLRHWGADSASDALAILPRALGQPWHDVLAQALGIFGTSDPSTADERAALLDDAEADDVLGLLDSRFYELEASQDADDALGRLADECAPWPGEEPAAPWRRLPGR